MPITQDRLQAAVEALRRRPGHSNVMGLVRELCVVGLDIPDAEVNFEIPVPEVRGRMDALFGSTIFEFKRDLRNEQFDAEEQLTRYLGDRERATGRRYLGIATDGASFVAYQLVHGQLSRLGEISPNPADPRTFLRWLDTAVNCPSRYSAYCRNDPAGIRTRWFGVSAQHGDIAGALGSSLNNPRSHSQTRFVGTTSRVRLRHLGSTRGAFSATHLFDYCREDDGGPSAHCGANTIRRASFLAGTPFTRVGLNGAVEADFFDWVLLAPGGSELVDRIAAQVARFRLAAIEVDVLKAVYESLIDPRQRHYLGEYYTPDWLASMMCQREIVDPLDTRILDPSCGSGTFLFHSVRRFLTAAEERGLTLQEALDRCTDHVFGLDVHPVAVLFSRVSYLLAIGVERLRQRSEQIFIPVYLGDSLQWDVRRLLTEEEVEITVPGEAPLRFPGSVAGDPHMLDATLQQMRLLADQNAAQRAFLSWLNANTSLPQVDRQILAESYERMRALHESGRNHIWSYIVRNLTRPLWMSLRAGKPDLVIGNPPWLRFNAMSAQLQAQFRRESQARGLWVGGRVATQQDLAAYFFARSVERYLPLNGRIAFVMPLATLSRIQYAGFRTGRFADPAGNLAVAVQFDHVWTFDSDVQPLFNVPCCVIFGHSDVDSAPLPRRVTSYRGVLPRRDASLDEVSASLSHEDAPWPPIAGGTTASVYRNQFKNGATAYPRRLFIVTPVEMAGLGVNRNAPFVQGRDGAQDKRPWNEITPPRGQIEREFLRPLLVGECIAPFRVIDRWLSVIPWANGLLTSTGALNAGYPYLADWMRNAEGMWERYGTGKMSLANQLDHYGKLSSQFPISDLRVVYSKAGVKPAAAVITDRESIIDHKLYWIAPRSLSEAYYLTAILNSETARARIEHLQSEGGFGKRDFDKVTLTLPIPLFDAGNQLHQQLAEQGHRGEQIAASAQLAPRQNFQSARNTIRRTLTASGLSAEIDDLVAQLLRA